MHKQKIPSAVGKKVSAATRKAGISAMSKALGHKIGTTKQAPPTVTGTRKQKKL